MRSLSATVLTVTFIGVVSISEAQTGWTGTVTTLSAPTTTGGRLAIPNIAVADNGDAYAVWQQFGAPGSTLIQAARYTAASDTWSAPVTLAGPGESGFADVAVDGAGNAFLVIMKRSGAFYAIDVLRYSPASGGATTVQLSSVAADVAHIAVDAAGNAMVMWPEASGIYAARYSAASAVWASPARVAFDDALVGGLAADAQGNIIAVWQRWVARPIYYSVHSAKFDVGTETWSAVTNLGEPNSRSPRVAVDPAGDATAVWSFSDGQHEVIQTARFTTATQTWSGVTELSEAAGNPLGGTPQVAADPAGNAIAVWLRAVGTTYVVQTARYEAGSASWGSVVDLSSPTGYAYPAPQVRLDASGNAIALWARSQPGFGLQIQAARYTAVANQWSAPVELSAAGQAAANPDIGFDAAGNATAIWFQTAGAFGAVQSTRWIQQPPSAPDAPRDLIVTSVTGNTVTLTWKPPASGTPTGYVLEGGLTPGSVLGSAQTEGAASTFTFSAPSGVFFVRVHALMGNLRSAASNEIQLIVNAPLPPSAPAALLGLVSGSSVALSWTNTFLGGAPTALQLNVTGAQTATIPLGVSDTVSFNAVPDGTYTVTLTASNAAGLGPPSDPVTLTVPGTCSGPPGVPTYFAVTKSDRTVTLTWNPPVSGTAVTSYVIQASGAVTGSLPTLTRSVSRIVGPGTYSLSVVAANECGTSAPTDPITVTVP